MAPTQEDLFHIHRPVMVSEVLGHLFTDASPAARRLVVDGTVGPGGHAEAMLTARDEVAVLGLDRDPSVLEIARRRLHRFGARARLRHSSYVDLDTALSEEGESAPWGVLLDLGASSVQLGDPTRGFSFREPTLDVDMRFDPTTDGPTALELVNRLPERELSRILHEYGEEPRARAVARALVRARPIGDGTQLVAIVRRHAFSPRRHDPATRTFQALRIAVNDELEHVERGVRAALRETMPGGRVVVLSFHSGEDRLVKRAMREAARAGMGIERTKKPQRPTDAEVRENRRARPARLRAFEPARIPEGGSETT